jgi:hypothetical protein
MNDIDIQLDDNGDVEEHDITEDESEEGNKIFYRTV